MIPVSFMKAEGAFPLTQTFALIYAVEHSRKPSVKCTRLCSKLCNLGTGEMTQELRVFVALAEDPSSIPKTDTTLCNSCSRASDALFQPFMATSHTWYTDRHPGKH